MLDLYQFLLNIILSTFQFFILINQNCFLSRVQKVAKNNATYLQTQSFMKSLYKHLKNQIFPK